MHDRGLLKYAFVGDANTIIESMDKRRVEWDQGVVFSKNGIVEYIEKTIKDATSDPKKWKN
jgi:hypothetical protein